jgi:hypothetical protein
MVGVREGAMATSMGRKKVMGKERRSNYKDSGETVETYRFISNAAIHRLANEGGSPAIDQRQG